MSFKVTVLPSQHEFTVEDGQSVLDAALAAGIVLPYSCRNGACSTCKGRVVEGSYEGGPNTAQIVSEEEREQGYTLFCQAKPLSDLTIEAHEVRMASDIQIRKMPSRIVEMEKLADDVMVLKVQLPASDPFRFYPGQYLDFILRDGKRRSYSMATPPNEANLVELHIRHTPGGAFTDHVFGVGATQMKLREIQRVEAPLGSFFLRKSDKPAVFLASGTGFAPIKAMIEHMIAVGDKRPVHLYWGGRRPVDLYMDGLAREWENQLPGFRYFPVVSEALPEDNWQGRSGFVHRAVMEDIPDLSGHQVYACGAPVMVDSARQDFTTHCNLPEEEFYADAFTTAAHSV
ncbi:CDP-6-deoxy-delta-3,4-glucoseen reductase [Achromobacter sp. F4_2707]|uniref:CDP-6-deoxy-delta-3,4-glucoseen reductase n=1 Tax=Achromobacter sp. F4_2707 TaxID=3114286 RepID=UPI0039C69E51